MPTARRSTELWELVRRERAALLADLEELDPAGWAAPTLCPSWTVEDVVAHLTAAASTGRVAWLRSMLAARFDPAVHNARRLAEQKGPSPDETLARFRAAMDSRTAASGHVPAWLGEVVVHAQDIRRPLGLGTTPSPEATLEVARFFARQDFAVNSASAVKGLRMEATDGDFSSGDGPLVQGPILALVMGMAGRAAYLEELRGPGVEVLRGRLG
ncbi:maleylpyruvate isomerase family mycothiol-dependent enzyme [Ornithinimicrobium panacihumi]|uniref:maleylpyruvate isomerase family mycothiol-dependent enzyme n=1 Tax=Ornithinimicrobium panacihumi TaxID=2008449 RepID=UPI003F8A5794